MNVQYCAQLPCMTGLKLDCVSMYGSNEHLLTKKVRNLEKWAEYKQKVAPILTSDAEVFIFQSL